MSSFISGTLETRIAYAQAKIGMLINAPEMISDEMIHVLGKAEAWGHYAFSNGLFEEPTLFTDEPELLEAFEYGFNDAADAETWLH